MLSDYSTQTDKDELVRDCLDMLESVMNSQKKNTYQETFLIKKDGKFNNTRHDGQPKYLIVEDEEELFYVVEAIEKLDHNYKFEIENDLVVGWCRYIVTRTILL